MKGGRIITGWARVQIRGERPERMLRALSERGIPFWDVTVPKDFSLELSLPARKARYVPAFAAALGCEGKVLKLHGLPALWRKLHRRRTLLICLGVLTAALAGSRLFVWRVEVEGTEHLRQGEVLAALDECGVSVGAFWPGFSQDMIRNAMLLKLPHLRWMTVNMQGCCARVILREAYEAEAPVQEDVPMKILAEKAGVVTRVFALRGTAAAAQMQAVLPGELLIDGLATGRFETHGPVRAIGSVEAETWYELSAQMPVLERKKARQEGKIRRWALVLGKRRINFYKGYSICPADCAKMTMETSLCIPELFFLPVSLVREEIFAVDTELCPAETAAACMQRKLEEELLARIGPEGAVMESHLNKAETDGVLTLTLRARCREEIGRAVPLSAGEIASQIPSTKEENS